MPALWTGQITVIQFALAIAAVTLAIVWPGVTSLRRITIRLRRLSTRRVTCGLIAAILPITIRLALLPSIPIPAPAIQEEFSNLLEADTFAHGRLANPPHPMSVFFDNVQIIQYPKYVSARLPGTAVFLWAGEAIFRQPWVGVCLVVAAMCGAFYWMLLGWTRPIWAFVCAILFGLRFGIFTYWINSYWPGSPAALGGALVLGATPRLAKTPAVATAVLYGAGCVILLFNRPAEGLLFIAPTTIFIALAWLRARGPVGLRRIAVNAIAPPVVIGAAALVWLLAYNKATTGCPNVLAYSVWRDGQAIVPNFWWEPLRKVHLIYYSRQTWQFFHVFERGMYDDIARGGRSSIIAIFWRMMLFARGDLGLFLLIPLLFPPVRLAARRSKSWLGCYFAAIFAGGVSFILYFHETTRLGFPLLAIYAVALAVRFGPRSGRLALPLILVLLGLGIRLLTSFSMPTYYPHFLAPAMILVAEGFRRLHVWRRRRRIGAAVARNVCLASVAMAAVQAAIPITGHHVTGEDPFYMTSYENRLEGRVRVERFLESRPGPQLAIVRYSPEHDVLLEWVWNGADIDGQKVVWAREQKPEWTGGLLRYYSSRAAWLIEPDAHPPRVSPYPALPPPNAADPPPEARYTGTPACR